MIWKIIKSKWAHLQKAKLGQATLFAKDVQINKNIDRLLHSRIGFQDFESLQTPDYKHKLKENVFAMTHQLGHFFLHFLQLKDDGMI